ncbi:unnamed protein product, partial [Phaeothamnion confervicola]
IANARAGSNFRARRKRSSIRVSVSVGSRTFIEWSNVQLCFFDEAAQSSQAGLLRRGQSA